MRCLLKFALAATLVAIAGCAERQTPATEADSAASRETRPPTAAEVPPAEIPPTVPPEPIAQPADPTPTPVPPPTPEPAPELEPTPTETAPETPATTPPQAEVPSGQPLEVISTDSGLIIEVLRRGTGDEVRRGDTIVAHYHGELATGRTFDSSYDRGEPLTINLFQTIPGWQEGIPGMKVGGKRRLIVPAELGYGRRARPNIPANSMLIFEIEVLDIVR